ncbi:hypothetical protein IFR05_015479 [Cadophora sp. M221]|nr:hypothetical protein IFR05_015479 [Cadophora sp. M221]
MKSFINPSMLFAALSTLAFTSALSPVVDQRQVIDTSPTVADCANSYDCKNAAAWWNDCQGAHVIGQPFDPSSNVRSCLCPPGRAVPSHIDWYSKFRNCIICVEMVVGNQYPEPPMYIQIEEIAGSPTSHVGYCHGTLSTEQFIQKTKDLFKSRNFPLSLPEAIMRPQGGEVVRAATSILDNDAHSRMVFSISKAFDHSGFTRADSTSTPTALPKSSFPTFPAVPMDSFLASISSVTPTAVPNSAFPTFSAVPMDSFLASLSSSSSLHAQSTKAPAGQVHTMSSRTQVDNCAHDNCFRQALRSQPAVASFCATYTKFPSTASSGIPSCLSGCENSPVKVSSACSCLVSHASSISSALPTSTQPYTSKTSTPQTSSTFYSTTSTHPASSTSTPTSSSTTVYPTANPTKWITLPASNEVRACAVSKGCVNSNIYYNTCMKENDEGAWNCLCKKWPLAWKTNLGQCTQCLEDNLPKFSGNYALSTTVEYNRDRWCQVNNPDKTGAKNALISIGADLTRKFESPLEIFNMTLIDVPYHPGDPQPTPAPVSPTSTTSTSAPLTTSSGLRWESLPASAEVVACSRSAECVRAGEIFNTCATEEKKLNGNVKYCFCNTNNKEWTSSLSTCASCIAQNLPASPPSTAPVHRDMVVKAVDMTTQIYCGPASQGSIERLQAAGVIITSNMQSPVKFFDMSLVTEAIPVPA